MPDLGPLEDDFVALHQDLARIAAAPHTLGNAASSALDQIIAEGRSTESSPESAVGKAFQDALYVVMRESAVTDMHGNMGFNVDQRSIGVHGAPVYREVVSVVQEQVQSFIDGLTSNVVAAVPLVVPGQPEGDRPTVKLKVDLMSLFAGMIQEAVTKATPPKKDK